MKTKNTVDAYRGLIKPDDSELPTASPAGASIIPKPADTILAPMLSKTPDRLRDIDITAIIPDPAQARKVFEGIEELSESIKNRGVLTPLIVSKAYKQNETDPDLFNLVAGERRWRAATLAGLKKVPCIVKFIEDPDEVGFIENVHRRDLTYIEMCININDIIHRKGYKQREFANRIVMAESAVSEAMKTAAFAEKYQQHMGSIDALYSAATKDGRPLGSSHFRQIVAQPTFKEQCDLFDKIIAGSLTIKKITSAMRKPAAVRPWSMNKFMLHLKTLRTASDTELLKKIDTSTITPKVISELEQTHAHFSAYLESLKAMIESVKR